MSYSDGLKDWLDRNPDAKVVERTRSGYDAEHDPDTHSSDEFSEDGTDHIKQGGDGIARSKSKMSEKGTDFIKEGTEYAGERLKFAKKAADKYTVLAFTNLRRAVLETIMSDGGPNSAARKVRRQTIAAVLGEEAWKGVESQYDIIGPAWDDAEAVTRALGALELADSITSYDDWDAWKVISPSSGAAILETPQRIQWLEKQGYIADRTSSYEQGTFLLVAAWLYFGLLTLLAFWILKRAWEALVWSWGRIRYGEISDRFEATPPKKRKSKTVKKTTRDIKRPKPYNFEHVKVEKRVKYEGVPKPRKPTQENGKAKAGPDSLDDYPNHRQYTEDKNKAQNRDNRKSKQQYADDVFNENYENDLADETQEEYSDDEGYGDQDAEESDAGDDQLEAETVPPQQRAASARRGNAYSYEELGYAEDTETGTETDMEMDAETDTEMENYATQDGEYEEEDVYDSAKKEDGGYEDTEEYSIIEEGAPQTFAAEYGTKSVQRPERYQGYRPRVSVAKVGPSCKAPGNEPFKLHTKGSRAHQTASARKWQ
ncbi:hypothetical protein EV426DRAFT_710562 [Tirmania nivea]|nr:hypothetical protein EV426DRAFT_710562 [Tirmania nivea]